MRFLIFSTDRFFSHRPCLFLLPAAGGASDEGDRYIAPTVLRFPDLPAYADSAAAKEEIFGPIMPLRPAAQGP